MANESNRDDVTEMTEDAYVPAETERKTAMLMYFVTGIIAALHKKQLTVFEIFHLKQSLGYWTVFFIVAAVSSAFVLIPYVWILPVLVFFVLFLVLLIFVKQALNGRYFIQSDEWEKLFLPFFHELWWWITDTFETKIEIKK